MDPTRIKNKKKKHMDPPFLYDHNKMVTKVVALDFSILMMNSSNIDFPVQIPQHTHTHIALSKILIQQLKNNKKAKYEIGKFCE